MGVKRGLSNSGKIQNCQQVADELFGSLRMGMTQEWGGKTLLYEALHNLHFSSNLIRIMK
jgi:hypothetical protein